MKLESINFIKGDCVTIVRDSVSGEIVHSHDLREMDVLYIQKTTFECPYDKCRIPATPCSFKEINLNQSYFRYKEPRRPGCKIHDPKSKISITQRIIKSIIHHRHWLYIF